MANNSDRLLNVVFVLDTTVSMKRRFQDSQTRILDEMNDLVERFLIEIMENAELCGITKVAFLTFSDGVTMETDFNYIFNLNKDCFKPLSDQYVQRVTMKNVYVAVPGGKSDEIQVPRFEDIGQPTYSRVGSGVIRALEKLDEAHESIREKLGGQNQSGSRPYVPVMVLISDGAPDVDVNGKLCPTADPEEERRAKTMVRSRCHSTEGARELVIPVICAIGDDGDGVKEQMKAYSDYSMGYDDGYQFISLEQRGNGFRELIVKLGQSLTRSISLADEKKKEKRKKAASDPKKKNNGKQEKYRKPPMTEDLDGDEDLKRTGK